MVSVESVSVLEGNGFVKGQVKVVSDQPFLASAAIWIDTGAEEGFQIDIPAGSGTVVKQFTSQWIGDSTYNPYFSYGGDFYLVSAMKGAVTGMYIGGLTLIEDDPVPKLSVVTKNVEGFEGASLRWKLKLSSPMSRYYLYVETITPGGTELNSNDVDRPWLQERAFLPPINNPIPLSGLGMYIPVSFDYGVMEAELVVPLTVDGLSEGDESIRLFIPEDYLGIIPLGGINLTGTVRGGQKKKKSKKSKKKRESKRN
jgi:hypothetical protein